MRELRQIWIVAGYEWFDALRSRRAIVVLLLYLIAAVCTMHWSINILQRMESELVKVLQLPVSERAGVVSGALWKSKPFRRIMRQVTRNDQVLQDVTGKHPVELIYAWFAFFYAPLLVVLVAGNRISEDIGSGAVRYVIFRTSRITWSLGKFVGQMLMVGVALVSSGLGAYLVAKFRLMGSDSPDLLFNILRWSIRAWVYSIPFLGIAMGISHFTRSASKATIFGIIAITLCFVITVLVERHASDTGWRSWLPYISIFVPNCYKMTLWRSSLPVLINGMTYLVALGFCYHITGCFFFKNSDV